MRHRYLPLVLLFAFLLAVVGCAPAATVSEVEAATEDTTTTETDVTAQTPMTSTAVTVETPVTTSTESAESTELEPTTAPEADEAVDVGADMPTTTNDYLDDRSTPESVLRSLFNAINSRHYLRAYSYWEPDAEGLPTFEAFEQSFAETDYVDLFDVGEVTGDAGAGQRYYTVPYIISVTNTDGSVEAFAGCYLLHISDPAIQATPPFQPLAIQRAAIQQMGEGDDSFTISANLCAELMG